MTTGGRDEGVREIKGRESREGPVKGKGQIILRSRLPRIGLQLSTGRKM